MDLPEASRPKATAQSFQPLALRVLSQSRYLAEFPRESLESLVQHARVRRLARREVLCHRGERVTELVVVLEGALDVGLTSELGKRHIQVILEQGQVMNLIPVLDEQPTLHSASTHGEAVLLLFIDRAALLAEADRDPRVAHALMRILCLRSRQLYAAAAATALLPLRMRCARTLHALMNQYGLRRGEWLEISLKLSQEEFADMVGRTRQSVNKQLKAFEQEGVIRMAYSQFHVLDEKLLAEIAFGKGGEALPQQL